MKFAILIILITSLLNAQELTIKAQQFKTDEKAGITIFSGDVEIHKQGDDLNASTITIYTNDKKEPTKFIAKGDVSFFIKTQDAAIYKGVAQKVIYFPIKKEYHFFENVYLEQVNNKKIIIGEEVVLKTIEGKAYAKGANEEPVIMIFDMPEKEEK